MMRAESIWPFMNFVTCSLARSTLMLNGDVSGAPSESVSIPTVAF